MAVNLDTRLPLAAVGSPLNPAGVLQNARSNAIQQKLDEMRMDYESRKRRRETDTERYMGEAINAIRQGRPAQTVTDFQWNTPNQTGIPQSPYEVSAREIAPAVPGRQPTLEDMQAASIDAMFKAGDLQGAFEAMKAARAGQVSQMKPYSGDTKIGPDGQAYAFNQTTARYEPTGFFPERPVKETPLVKVETNEGTKFVRPKEGMTFQPPAKPGGNPRYQIMTDSTGTYRVNLDNPSDVVQITKPGGESIVKPQAVSAPTEDERKAAGWVAQADNAWKNMQSVLSRNPSGAKQGFLEANLPEGMANMVRSEDRQLFLQAASSFSEAALRAATGAGVTEIEAKQKIRELTPVIGDSPAVVRQKLASIPVYLESLKTRAGRALTSTSRVETNQLPPASKYPGKVATDNTTGIKYKSDGNKWVRVP